jgi:hypothetical protein
VAFGPFGLKGAPDHFFRNEEGRFVDATEEVGMKDLAWASASPSAPSIWTTTATATSTWPRTPTPTLSWGTALADLDNDGDLDLVIANGHIYPQIDKHPEIIGNYRQRNLLLENRRLRDDVPSGTPPEALFRDVTDQAGPGFQPARPHRGLVVGDYDNDGHLDILVTALD